MSFLSHLAPGLITCYHRPQATLARQPAICPPRVFPLSPSSCWAHHAPSATDPQASAVAHKSAKPVCPACLFSLSPSSGAHHERDVLLGGELEREARVARVAGRHLRGLAVPLQAVVVALALGQDVTALGVPQDVPRLYKKKKKETKKNRDDENKKNVTILQNYWKHRF